MKKPKNRRTKASAKVKKRTPVARRKAPSTLDAFDEALMNMSEEDLNRFLLTADEFGLDDADDAEELFSQFLDYCVAETDENDEDGETLEDIVPDLISALGQLQVGANGGGPVARKEIENILEMLDDAIEEGLLDGGDLMLTAKVLADAGWKVPDRLKRASLEALENGPLEGPGEGASMQDLVASLQELAEQLDNDEFQLFEHLNSMMEAFPPEVAARFVWNTLELGRGALDRAIVGFVLHPREPLATAALDALAQFSSRPVESLVIERLVRMRPWLAAERRANLDAAVRALRPNAEAPVKADSAPVQKAYLSTCDGAGAHQILVATRKGRRHSVLALLIKSDGVADLAVLDEMKKSDLDGVIATLKSTTPTAETDVAALSRMLSFCLADNLANGVPPPFRLVQFAERIGLGPVTPRVETADEIAAELLAALDEATNAAAIARAYRAVADSEVTSSWFEAGAVVEDLLAATKTRPQRVKKLLATYLTERKPFWARQCAFSALALQGAAGQKPSPYCIELALIARDLASDRPTEEIPLMRQIAQTTAQAFEHNRRFR